MRIIILEDNPADADLCKRALAKAFHDCSIEIAPTLKKARELLEGKTPFQLALLDMNLPDGNGLEILAEIRNRELKMAVVVFTATGNEEVAVAALKAGANDYIAKRTDYPEQLPTVILTALKNYQQQVQLQNETIAVLHIEHNSMDIDLTNRHLKKYAPNIHLNTITTAEAGIKLLSESKGSQPFRVDYKVILMDYRLQGMSALDFIKKVRQELQSEIPIIIVTGQGDEEVAVQALKLGASDYISKGVNYLFRLPELIKSACQQAELKRKQAELAESEAKYRLIAENSGDVIFTLDMNLNYTYVSPAVKAMRGYEPEEAMQQKIQDVLTPESYQRAIKLISESLFIDHELLRNPLPKHIIELEMIRKDRTTIWIEVLASLIIDDNNKPIGILGVSRDISKRKAALDELRKLNRAVEQSPDSILITNIKGEIEYINPALCRISGYTAPELIGKNPRIFSSGDKTQEEIKMLWHTISKGTVWQGEFQNKKKWGELYWESTTISPVTDSTGKITHYLAIRKDITEQKRMTSELIDAKERAEESDRLKSAFLANMSHEIRTPMNSIMGFASLLPKEESKELINQYAQVIVRNSEQLVNIIDDIVLYSRLQAGILNQNVREFDVCDLLADVRNSFELPEFHQGVELVIAKELQCPFNIRTDYEKLRQVFVNLVSNAFKYTPSGSIRFGAETIENQLVFFVKDSGIGIPAGETEKVFDRFYRGSNTRKETVPGTGLGLSIVKELIDLLGGKIWVESQVGKGSTFYFKLNIDQ